MGVPDRAEHVPAGRAPARTGAPPARLEAAAARVLATRDPYDGSTEYSADAEALAQVVSSVESLQNGADRPTVPREDIPRLLRHRRLSDALERELLRDREATFDDDESSPAEATLDLVTALNEYRDCLRPEEGNVLTGLAPPEALELIVEVAHDLRSPLNSTLFLSEALRSGHSGPVNDQQRSQLGLVYSATLGMISVVSDVMELAGAGRGATADDPVDFSIGEMFEAVEELVAPVAEEAGIAMRFHLPSYDRCVGYPIPIRRILLNLTTNALKFTDEGEVALAAERVDRSIVEFSVRDTGRGMPPEALVDLYSPLRKSPSREGHFFSPSGLGLIIVRRLLSELGSTLEIDTKEGEGTLFSFQLNLPAR